MKCSDAGLQKKKSTKDLCKQKSSCFLVQWAGEWVPEQSCVGGACCCWTVHPTDITTAYGSPAPKPSFFWNTACVSEGGKFRKSVSLITVKQHKCCELMRLTYLCEFDWLFFGNVFCIFACKHSTVTTVHLLWDFLRTNKKEKWLDTINVKVHKWFCTS